jgi:hypothetical protein
MVNTALRYTGDRLGLLQPGSAGKGRVAVS